MLKPDWLATAVSFALDDEVIREANGLASFGHLSHLWNDPNRDAEFRYPLDLHPLFLRLMERFDLSYKVALPDEAADAISFWGQFKGRLSTAEGRKDALAGLHYTSLIGQLVRDTRPEGSLAGNGRPPCRQGDGQQVQICRIVDEKGQSAPAEGLFYQLIVRLHKYSLGRMNYDDSVHWQRGLVLDHDYNGRALLEHIGNDVRITARAPYPEGFLTMLTSEVKFLVESFWEGLRCDVMVPCITPCGINDPGAGLYEVGKLINSKRKHRPEYPCPVCDEWQSIDHLLRNAPASRPVPTAELIDNQEVLLELRELRLLLFAQGGEERVRFDRLDAGQRELLSKADAAYNALMGALTDEAREGPRLFSLVPADRRKFDPRKWTSEKFRLTLWCEHSRLPLPALNGRDSRDGVYDIELSREWFRKAAPFLKVLTGTLSLVLPVASSAVKLALDEAAYEAIDEQLDFGKKIMDASLTGGEKIDDWLEGDDAATLERGQSIQAQGATLRRLQVLLKEKDPGFGGLVRVMNKRQEFLWVHPRFESEY